MAVAAVHCDGAHVAGNGHWPALVRSSNVWVAGWQGYRIAAEVGHAIAAGAIE